MTQVSQPCVTTQILNSQSGGPSGSTDILPPLPPQNIVSDEWWATWPGAQGPMMWDSGNERWFTNQVSGELNYGLIPITSGPNANWAVGFRASTLRVTIGSSDFLGPPSSLTVNSITLLNSFGSIVGTVDFDFNSYNENLTFDIPINNTADLDYGRIQFATQLQNTGPLISLIRFFQ